MSTTIAHPSYTGKNLVSSSNDARDDIVGFAVAPTRMKMPCKLESKKQKSGTMVRISRSAMNEDVQVLAWTSQLTYAGWMRLALLSDVDSQEKCKWKKMDILDSKSLPSGCVIGAVATRMRGVESSILVDVEARWARRVELEQD